MREKAYYPVLYMFVITCGFSLLLFGFARLTDDKVKMNAQMAFERAVIGVFPELSADTNARIHQLFTDLFRFDEPTKAYVYTKDGQVKGYAVPFAGPGFWDEIEGVLGIAADQKTVTGITFYKQTETPGLGARIDEEEFKNQFAGLQIQQTAQPIGIRPVTRQLDKHEVHAVTGATQTSVRLEKLINDNLSQWLQRQTLKETAQ
jgi:Na+-transporting NADH:ubiquinone oxidoreductase subunit C